MIRCTALLAVTLLICAGCRPPMTGQSPFGSAIGSGGRLGGNRLAEQLGSGQFPQLAEQIDDLSSRLARFNSDNDNLHTQVAALQQRLQNANDYNEQLKQQLSDTIVQLQQTMAEKQQLAQKTQSIPAQTYNAQFNQASTGGTAAQFAGATIRANNSLMGKLQSVQSSGLKAWMDGDVIRIETPSDQLFVPGSYQISQQYAAALTNLANIIRQNFPRQVIGVESHWDGTPIQPASTSHHQLTATQALAVFDFLVKTGLPHDQVFTMAMGSNRPRYNVAAQNGVSPNRRIEIVIYPETFN